MENLDNVTLEGALVPTQIKGEKIEISTEFAEQVDEKLAQLKEGKLKKGMSITPSIFTFENIGDKVVGVFLGYRTLSVPNEITKLLEDKPAVFWIDETKNLFCNLGKSMVENFRVLQRGTAFEAELIEIKKLGGGKSFKNIKITPYL